MVKDESNFKIKQMECEGKPIPQKYINVFNSYIEGIEENVTKQLADLKCANEKLQEEYDDLYDDVYFRVSEEWKLENGYEHNISWANGRIEELEEENKRLRLENAVLGKETQLKRRELNESEYQHYCAYKIIEPEIKGCLDREKQYKQQLKEKDEEIEHYKWKPIEEDYKFPEEHDYDDFLKEILNNPVNCHSNWSTCGKYIVSHETYDNGIGHNVMVANVIEELKEIIKKKDMRTNTNQICEKIKKDFIKNHNQKSSILDDPMDSMYKRAYNECLYDLRNFLDQVEKGENK